MMYGVCEMVTVSEAAYPKALYHWLSAYPQWGGKSGDMGHDC